MIITLSKIIEVFEQLISNSITREFASNWAQELQLAIDKNQLEFYTVSDKEKILKGIFYLLGVDLKDSPSSYLHDLQDIIDFKDHLRSNSLKSKKID